MALTRKFLSALGIEADKVDEIIAAHTETVDALKEQRDSFKADAEKLVTVQAELDKLKEEAAKDSGDPFEVKYNALKKDYEKFKAEAAEKENARQVKEAYRTLLKDAGIAEKRIDAVLKVTNLKDMKLGEDGKLEKADELSTAIQTEWADFISVDGKKGAEVPNPPKENPQPDYDKMSDADYYKLTYKKE